MTQKRPPLTVENAIVTPMLDARRALRHARAL